MEEQCNKCHVLVRSTDYFCYNCGKNLKPVPPSVTPYSQFVIYLESILLPPFGLLWAVPYLRQTDKKSRIVGIIAIVLTLISLIITTILFQRAVTQASNQLNQQLNYLNY